MNIRPVKRPLLEEEEETPTIHGTPSIEWLSRELEKNPLDVGLRFGKARQHMKTGEWEDAREELKEILFIDPDQGQAWKYLALSEKMLGNQEGVVHCYEQLEELNLYDEEILCEHGKSLLRVGRYAGAKEMFERVLEIDETCADAWAGRSEAIRFLLTPALPHDPEVEISSEDEQNLLEGYERALDLKPDCMPALQGMAEWAIHRGRHQEGMTNVEKILTTAPYSCRGLEQKGRLLERIGNQDDAMEHYTQSATCELTGEERFEPANLYSKASAMDIVGNREDSLRCLEKIIDIDRTNQQALMKRAEILTSLGRLEEASETYEKLVSLRPRDHYLWHLKGNVEKESKQHERALESFDMSLTYKPDYIPAVYSKSETLYRMGRLSEGKDVVDSLLAMDPENVDGLKLSSTIQESLLRGDAEEKRDMAASEVVGGRQNNPPKTQAHVKTSVTHQPRTEELDMNPLDGARRALMKGDHETALSILQRGETGGDWRIMEMLGKCHRMRGDVDEAVSAYKKAASINPNRVTLYTSAARLQYENKDLFGALDSIRSCPMKDNEEITRAEIEIEAEILVENIRNKLGVMKKKQGTDGFPGGKNTPERSIGPVSRMREKWRSGRKKNTGTDTHGNSEGENPAASLDSSAPLEENVEPEEASDFKQPSEMPETMKIHLHELREKIERSLGETPSDDLLWYARSLVCYQLGNIKNAIYSMEKAIWLKQSERRYLEAMSELMMLLGQSSRAEIYKKRAEDLEREETAKNVDTGPRNSKQKQFSSTISPTTEQSLHCSFQHRIDPLAPSSEWGIASGSSTTSPEPTSVETLMEAESLPCDDLDEWGMILMEEWKNNEEVAVCNKSVGDDAGCLGESVDAPLPVGTYIVPCPHCGVPLALRMGRCAGCGSLLFWTQDTVVEDAFFDDLIFFDCMKDALTQDSFSYIHVDLASGELVLATKEEGGGGYDMKFWRCAETGIEGSFQTEDNLPKEIMTEDLINILKDKSLLMKRGIINGMKMERDLEAVLRYLMQTSASAPEIGQRCDVPIAKCYRMLADMERTGLVKRQAGTGDKPVYSINADQVSLEIDGMKARIRLSTILELAESLEHRMTTQ